MTLDTYRTSPAALALAALFAVGPDASAGAETIKVARGGNLQTALNAAKPGDTILLEAGAEFVGNFVLPVKSGATYIVVRSSTPDAGLPGPGQRISPSHAPLLARVRSPNAMAALKTAAGAHHWKLQYLEFAANQNGYGDILQIGDGSSAQNTLAKVPYELVLDHLYIHGDPLVGQKRGISLNAANVTIRDSYISECKGVGMDTQAIAGWNGPGPYVIEGNYLEGAGENVMFGGADPAIPNLVTTGVVLRHNYFSRPMSWRNPIIPTPSNVTATPEAGGVLSAGVYSYRVVARRNVGQGTTGRSAASVEVKASVALGGAIRVRWDPVSDAAEYRVYGRTAGSQSMYWTVQTNELLDTGATGAFEDVPTSGGTEWVVKNLFELKNARDVLAEYNVFENHWKQAQAGYAIVFTPRNSNGGCTWCVVENVRFQYNVVRNVAAGINLLGYDIKSRPTRQTNAITIRHNLFYDVTKALGGNGWFMLIGDEPRNIVIDHNTIEHDGTTMVYTYGGTQESPRRVLDVHITNNAVNHSTSGFAGEFFQYGIPVLNGFYPGATFKSNFLAGGTASRYPETTIVNGTFESQFANAASNDFTLAAGSALRKRATDGTDIGADIGAVLNAASGTTAGLAPPRSPSGFRLSR